MIKMGSFKFEELQGIDHWAQFACFGDWTDAKVDMYTDYREIDPFLDPGKVYQLSMDQSTSNTGIFIKDFANTEAFMIECSRGKDEQPDDFIFNLEMFLHRIGEGNRFSHLLYEKPIKTESFRSAQVLFQLEGMIRALVKRYDEFRCVKLDNIENSSWRRVVIDDERFGSYPRKKATMYSIIDAFDWADKYGWSIGSDYDIFEAMGVMFGWFVNSHDHLGRPYVRGNSFSGNIGGFVLPFASAKDVSEEFAKLGLKSEWYMENPRKSIYENIACAIKMYEVVCVELTTPYSMLALSVECNIKWMDPDRMTLVLVAANYVDKRVFSVTGKEYHFVL